ncbi:hypothetical protein BD779DRAFT_1475909 [Infundibulicybe gibba]|nr:hypothetical protein BD779DRAFT_1475909 [Infundibulicybe gibba]
MGKRKRPQIDSLSQSEDFSHGSAETVLHTDLTATDSGLSVSGRYYAAAASHSRVDDDPIIWNTPTECAPLLADWDPSTGLPGDFMDTTYIDSQWAYTDPNKPKRARTASDNPLLLWIPEIDSYLSELLRLDGRGLHQGGLCPDCNAASQDCIVKRHNALPFHRPKEWKDGRFVKTSLMNLGLHYQLGHPSVNRAPTPLLRLIAVLCEPKTAATFRVLELFHLLSLTSKISAYEYYQTIHRRTDNIGVNPPPNISPNGSEWRHLKMLKRAGRGHDPSGVSGTKEGELALLCPACPHPGKNLPENWRECSPKEKWRYALFLGIDANFRLKRLNVSNSERDPGLNHGYAYFVHDTAFKNSSRIASIRGGKGTAASGVGTIECSRHDMKRPVSLGDLQKGERYVNMDYFFLSSVQFDSPDTLCLQKTLLLLFPNFIYLLTGNIVKLPITQFPPASWKNRRRSARARVGRLKPSSKQHKEMGPGSRRDTLDDILGDYNWRKITSLFTSILRKAKEAVSLREEHVAAFKTFSAALPPDTIAEWTHTVQEWELDASMPNPFEPKYRNAVRLELAQEEALAIASREISIVHEDITPSLLMSQGLELEDLQRRLRMDIQNLNTGATDLQRAKLVERSNRLRRQIDAWIEVQHLYMPSVAALRARADREGGGAPIEAINIQLMLPSHVVGKAETSHFLLQYEWRLRFAYAHDVLQKLRRHVLLRTHMYRSKNAHGQGQHYHTRSLDVIKGVQAKIVVNTIRAAELDAVGEGRRSISWIWKVGEVPEGGSNDVMQQALKIEWCKIRACAHRWQEECILLEEETARVVAFFKWEAQRWKNLAGYVNPPGSNNDGAHEEGCRAYALQQIDNRDLMRSNCERAWRDLESWFQMGEGNANGCGFVEAYGGDEIQISKI